MAGFEDQATFENSDSTFTFHKMYPSRKCRSTTAVAQNGHADPGEGRAGVDEHNGELHTDRQHGGNRQICSFMWADNYWFLFHTKAHLEEMMKDLIEAAER